VKDVLIALDMLLTDQMQRPDLGAARLFIDRRFTIQGMGTVVTGTLLEGKLTIDQQVIVEPSGLKTRIRSLQTHKHKITEATPGSRVAINLAGVEKSAIDRGEAVCQPGTVSPTQKIAAELSLLPSAKISPKSGFEVSFILGTADLLGRIYYIDNNPLKPGQTAFVKMKLNSPVAAKLGDHFIIRRISPQETIGGGLVLDTEFLPDGKNRALQRDILTRRSTLSPKAIILTELDKSIKVPLAKLYYNIPFRRREMDDALKALAEEGEIQIFGENVMSRKSLDKYIEPVLAIVQTEHDLRPWSDGVEPGFIAKKLKLGPERLPAVIDYLVSTGKITYEKGFLKLVGHEAQLNPEQMRMQGRLNARLSASPLSAPTRKDFIDEDPKYEVVINFLRDKGDIIELKGGILFTRRDFDIIVQNLSGYLKEVRKATASDIKNYLKTSRKYIIPILEKLDQMGITIRDGDHRRLADQ
jgi:selenocysteine-specific elongation factor